MRHMKQWQNLNGLSVVFYCFTVYTRRTKWWQNLNGMLIVFYCSHSLCMWRTKWWHTTTTVGLLRLAPITVLYTYVVKSLGPHDSCFQDQYATTLTQWSKTSNTLVIFIVVTKGTMLCLHNMVLQLLLVRIWLKFINKYDLCTVISITSPLLPSSSTRAICCSELSLTSLDFHDSNSTSGGTQYSSYEYHTSSTYWETQVGIILLLNFLYLYLASHRKYTLHLNHV